ncbi:MAG: two-component system, OmpR family, phosphate regulon sensor histidine kinase PhoR [Candidatus Parcubacteria bacterium]|jgi:PAS domain S-box-containing protein|nr:two-component system, OmpR family, phosphate regulon sensor histidine kinase PhoR [Candidatus Parcubacteria bacterium]
MSDKTIISASNKRAVELKVLAEEKESIRRKLVVTAKKLAVTAKEREIVRRKLAVTAEGLEQIRARNEAMLASIGDGLVATDKSGRILFVNKVFEKLLGWQEAELRGKLIFKEIQMIDDSGKEIPASERPTVKILEEHTAHGTRTISGTYNYVRKDKTRLPVAMTLAPVILDNKIIGSINVFRDITREKEIDKAKSEFITLASHQLKTPPTAIKLLTERLLGSNIGTLTEKQKEYLGDIHSTNERMIELVNALLNVSRIELGAFTINVEEKNVCAIIQNILDELQPIIDKKRLQLKTLFPVKNILLMLDEPLFRIVINNLVTNAIFFTAEGGEIQVECEVVEKGQSIGERLLRENSFVVVISDTGLGIPQKDQDKLFTKFFRADNARNQSPSGTGLGLYIVKSVLDHSGGLIWFISKAAEGTAFYVAIPMTGMRVID